MSEFNYKLGASVAIRVSDELGIVIARAEYLTSENAYLVRYKTNEGVGVEAWWGESALN